MTRAHKLAKSAGITAGEIGGLGRAAQITKIQQALTAVGIRFRVLSPAGHSLEQGIKVIRGNPEAPSDGD